MAVNKRATVAKKEEKVENPFSGQGGYMWRDAGDVPMSVPYANNDEITADKFPFSIDAIYYEEGLGYEGADRWIVVAYMDFSKKGGGAEHVAISLAPNDKRNEVMAAAQKFLLEGRPLGMLYATKAGRAIVFNQVRDENEQVF